MSRFHPASPPPPPFSRNALIAGGVVLLHVGGLWALQTGLLRRAVEVVVPAEILSQIIEPPKPKVEPPPPAPPPPPPPQPRVRREPTLPPPPQPVAIQDPTPAPNAPTGVVTPQPPPPPVAAPVAPAPAPPAPPPAPPPPRIVLPSSDAAYLNNPLPPYPRMSMMLGEQGRVVLSVVIGVDGRAKRATIVRSSGFPRLDDAARETVLAWRYTPGKRNGVVEEMEFDVPINWQLNNR